MVLSVQILMSNVSLVMIKILCGLVQITLKDNLTAHALYSVLPCVIKGLIGEGHVRVMKRSTLNVVSS